MDEPTTPGKIGKEFGVMAVDVTNAAEVLGINARRRSAKLTPTQATQLRNYFTARSRPRPTTTSQRPPISPESEQSRHGTCKCCEMKFVYHPNRVAAKIESDVRCGDCRKHYHVSGESSEREIERLSNHNERLRKHSTFAAEHATQYESRMKSALRSRDLWRAALVRALQVHQRTGDGRCACGLAGYPCPTVTTLEEANQGIARQVERFLTLDDDELAAALREADD